MRGGPVSDRRPVCGSVGNRGGAASPCSLHWIGGRGLVAAAALAGGLRPLDAAAAGIPAVYHSGIGHREFARTLALRRAYRNLLVGAAADCRVLGGSVGTRRPD